MFRPDRLPDSDNAAVGIIPVMKNQRFLRCAEGSFLLHAFLRDKKSSEEKYMKKFNTERLVVSAVLIALATVLSLFQPLRLPAG